MNYIKNMVRKKSKWWARLASAILREFSDSMKPTYGVRSYTDSGEYVKSKGEKKVADWLRTNGFKYEYEKKFSKNMKLYHLPDFTVTLPSGKTVYIEYLGMYENFKDYRVKNHKKMEDYRKAGINCIYLFPHNLNDLDDSLKPYLLL